MIVSHFSILHRTVTWTGALALATSIHGVLAWGIVAATQKNDIPPRLVSGFEVVELPSSSASKNQKSERVADEVVPAEPEPLLHPVAEPKPMPQPKPLPKPVVPDVQAKSVPQRSDLAQERSHVTPFRDTDAQSRAMAYVAPSQHVVYLKNPKPAYPLLARQRGQEGRVVLRAVVRADGTVNHVEVETSSGHALLDRASRTAVLRWRFAPATRGGVAVESEVLIPFDFSLSQR